MYHFAQSPLLTTILKDPGPDKQFKIKCKKKRLESGNAECSQFLFSTCFILDLFTFKMLLGPCLYVMITTNSSLMNKRKRKKNNRKGIKGTKIILSGMGIRHMLATPVTVQSKLSCATAKNCNRCQKITALVKSTPKAPAQGLIQIPEANEHPSPDINFFSNSSPLISSVMLGGEHK